MTGVQTCALPISHDWFISLIDHRGKPTPIDQNPPSTCPAAFQNVHQNLASHSCSAHQFPPPPAPKARLNPSPGHRPGNPPTKTIQALKWANQIIRRTIDPSRPPQTNYSTPIPRRHPLHSATKCRIDSIAARPKKAPSARHVYSTPIPKQFQARAGRHISRGIPGVAFG